VKVIDDFLFLALTFEGCNSYLDVFLEVARMINLPIAFEKTSKLNTLKMLAQLPVDKLELYSASVEELLQKDKVQLRKLQSVIGKLQFATTVIKIGKSFLRRLYDLTCHVAKPFYMVYISKEAKEDLRMWLDFLRGYNGKTILYQPSITESNAINLFTDASGVGFGWMYGSDWVQGRWTDEWASLNIAVLELYPIVLLLQLFGHKMANTRVLFHCDNAAIVEVINRQTRRVSRSCNCFVPWYWSC
jgi:hypothetical protein